MALKTTTSAKTKRLIVAIDSDRCTGCGDCVDACLTGALQLVDDKAKLIDEKSCDGFGSCIAACKHDVIRLENREAEDFDWLILNRISFDALMTKLRLTSRYSES